MMASSEMNTHNLTMPTNREFLAGDLLAQTLSRLGISVAFGLHGGHLDAFLMGASDVGIRLVDTRHETAAVQAAEGYSKVKRQVGVCFFTANSGFGNALPGLSTAFADRSSIFCVTSSSPLRDVDMNVLQGFHDQVVVAKPVTKWVQRVTVPEEIPRLVAYGIRQATTAPAGPVVLDVPIEVLFSPVRQSKIAWGAVSAPMPFPPGPHPDAIAAAVPLISASERPVIVTGTGARFLKGDVSWDRFLTSTQIPVFNSTKYSAPLVHDHPLRAGNAGLLNVLCAIGKSSPDLVILVGCRTGMFLGSRSAPAIPPSDKCRYIQIDADGGEIGRAWHVDVGITSDVRPAFAALADAVSPSLTHTTTHYTAPKEWTATAVSLKNLPMPQEKEAELGPNNRLHPFHATKTVLSALPQDSIVSIDGGECGSWAAQLIESARAHEFFFACGYLGFLGNGWGYSLGAAVADPNRLVVNVQGDGSAGFHIAELDTYARHGVRVLTVVMNNYCWGMSNAGQDLMYGREIQARPTSALSPKMDFAAVARGMGCTAEKVETMADVKDAVGRWVDEERPGLLEVLVDSYPVHPGTVAMVGKTDDKDVVVIPYYDNVDRPRYQDV